MNDQAPWLENTYFDTPKSTGLSLPLVSGWTEFVPPNIKRVGLMIGCQSGGGILVAPSNTLPATSAYGLWINNNSAILQLKQKDWGPLVSGAWYYFSTVALTVTYVELLLREWPRKQPWIIVNPPEGA